MSQQQLLTGGVTRGRVLEAFILAAAFAVAYTQAPLYYQNQNQYLLHGYAAASHGHLHDDWLANTRDPTPAFSWLVTGTYRVAGEPGLQTEFFLLLMGYFLSMRWLVHALPAIPDTRSFRLAWAALFTTTHAALPRVVSVALTGIDLPWYFQAGLAAQYILGPGLQPSAFGVLFIPGLAAFAHGRPRVAAGLAAGAAVMHSTYLLPAGLFTLGTMLALWKRGERRTAMVSGVVALGVVTPVLVYSLTTFAPTDRGAFLDAQRILSEVRIPHHCNIDRWLDFIALLQVGWMAAGLTLLRRTPLFPVLAVMAGGGLLLTLMQAAVESPTLALLFPWRVSAVLVPVATAVLLARLAAREPAGRTVTITAALLLVLMAVGGAGAMTRNLGYRVRDEDELFTYVHDHETEGDVYLLPMAFPKVGSGRGAVSNTFVPLPPPDPKTNQIPPDLMRFRLLTGAPIYVDFKSVPYHDVEVQEWHRRMEKCQAWYAGNWNRPAIRLELKGEGITHVVTPVTKPISAPYLEQVHRDKAYIVYRVR